MEKPPANHTSDPSLVSRGNKALPRHDHNSGTYSTRKWANVRKRWVTHHSTVSPEGWVHCEASRDPAGYMRTLGQAEGRKDFNNTASRNSLGLA